MTAHGLAVWVVKVPYGLNVGLGASPGVFKYLSYRVAGGDELVVDVWKSTFGPAGNVSRGQRGCLTLNRVSAAAGMVTASGTAHGLFESRFRAVLRDAFGGVLASRPVSASGGWHVALRYTARQGQGASLEAAASSAKDGALGCLVQKVFALPASNPRANLHVLYRAYADVNGYGRRDLVTVRRTGSSKGQFTVALAGSGRLSVTTPSDAVWLPGLVASGNVDGRPGEELIKFGTHQWKRQDTVYVWQGPALKLLTRGAAERLRGQPPPALVGVQCGHLPSEAPASDGPAAARTAAPPVGGPPITPLLATSPPTQRTNSSHPRSDNGGSRLGHGPVLG